LCKLCEIFGKFQVTLWRNFQGKVSSKRFKLSCQKFLETFVWNFDESFLAATLAGCRQLCVLMCFIVWHKHMFKYRHRSPYTRVIQMSHENYEYHLSHQRSATISTKDEKIRNVKDCKNQKCYENDKIPKYRKLKSLWKYTTILPRRKYYRDASKFWKMLTGTD